MHPRPYNTATQLGADADNVKNHKYVAHQIAVRTEEVSPG